MTPTPAKLPPLLACLFGCILLLPSCQGVTPRESEQVVAGSYDAETRYDMLSLSGALASSVQGWQSPDQAIQEQILGRFEKKYNKSVASAIRSSYGTQISSQILGHVQVHSPPWMLNMSSTLDTVDAQLGRVDVQTSMLIAQAPDGGYKVTQIWNGISVFRDPACRDGGGLDCSQIALDSKALLDAEYPVEIVSASFDATQEGRHALTLSGQNVAFNYGRLALYLITNLALPDEPGQGLQLRDIMLAAINCRGVAGRLAGGDGILGWKIAGVEVGLSLNDLVGSCEDGVFGMINGFIDQFNVPLTMNVGGQLTLLDPNRDGVVDQISTSTLQGTVRASLRGGTAKEGPVSGQMTGWRVGDVVGDGTGGGDGGETVDDGTTLWDGSQ